MISFKEDRSMNAEGDYIKTYGGVAVLLISFIAAAHVQLPVLYAHAQIAYEHARA